MSSLGKVRLHLVLLLIVAIGGSAAAHDWSFFVFGYNYGPYRDGQQPYGGCPGDGDLAADMLLMKSIAVPGDIDLIRTYALTDGCDLWRMIPAAEQAQVRVLMGLWLDGTDPHDQAEVDQAIAMAEQHPATIAAVCVGSETLLRGDLTLPELVGRINQVKAALLVRGLFIPVTTAEPQGVWLQYPTLAKSVDFLSANIHPFSAGIPAGSAAEWTLGEYQKLAHAFPLKPVLIAETGWPTEGDPNASVANQLAYLGELYALASRVRVPFLIFEFFDESWKTGPAVEAHWGLFKSDRTPKF